jgi:hypothetical protein
MQDLSRTRLYIIALLIGGSVLTALLGILFLRSTPQEPEQFPVVEEPIAEQPFETVAVIGASVEGRDIVAHTFGSGSTHMLFVGGVHGGYEWNSVLLAYEMIDHIRATPSMVPDGLALTIIPSLNPDGMHRVTGKNGRFVKGDLIVGVDTAPARFNANGVDLNRNFDCKWQPTSTWRGNVVSAGTAPFSEPEAKALRDWVLDAQPAMAVFWHSIANNVYASECEDGILPETLAIMAAYADAANYGKVESFDAYPITGDVEGWLASIGIPAITVELETRDTIEWERNLAGVRALITRATQYSAYAR